MQNESAPDPKNAERRRELRHIACYPTDLQRASGKQELSLIRDLSTTGALLFTRKTMEIGEPIALELHLGEEASATVARVDAKVVRSEPRPDKGLWRYSVAVEFVRPLTEWREQIAALGATLPAHADGES